MPGKKGKGRKRKTGSSPLDNAVCINKPKMFKSQSSQATDDEYGDIDDIDTASDNSEHSRKQQGNMCHLCHSTAITTPSNDQPIDCLSCDICGSISHIFCLGFESAFDGKLKDLVTILGWQCHDCKVNNKTKISQLQQSCSSLKTEISKLKTANNEIRKQLALLKSTKSSSPTDIQLTQHHQSNVPMSSQYSQSTVQTGRSDQNSQSTSYAGIVVGNNHHQQSAQPSMETILKSVHLDLINKSKKKSNIVISGLDPSDQCPDKELAFNLLWNHWGTPLEVLSGCRRLGKQHDGKTRPLLVNLKTEAMAETILLQAKNLRQSQYHEVRSKIYINPDLTRAESLALYDIRQKRREKNSRQHQQPTQHEPSSSFIPGPLVSMTVSNFPVSFPPHESATRNLPPSQHSTNLTTDTANLAGRADIINDNITDPENIDK